MFTKWTNFSPRLGLAYDVRGDGSTSVRASYGLFYDFMPLAFWTSRVPAFVPAAAVQAVKLDDPWATFPGAKSISIYDSGSRSGGKVPVTADHRIHSVSPADPTGVEWNLSIQKQIGRDWIASASYLGSQSAHLWTVRALNPAVFLGLGPCTLNGVSYPVCSTTANTDQRRTLSLLNPAAGEFYSFVNELDQGATASYNGTLLSLQRRAARGVTLNANYTWSHCIADLTNNQPNSGGADGAYLDPSNRRFDRGNCQLTGQDRRQLFNFTAVAASPTFTNKTLRLSGHGMAACPAGADFVGSCFDGNDWNRRRAEQHCSPAAKSAIGRPVSPRGRREVPESCGIQKSGAGKFG